MFVNNSFDTMERMKFPSKHAIIVVLLWAFAPLAWFLMWQDKSYHTWFPKLLWINGIIFGVIFITQSFVAIPRLNAVYDAFHIHVPPYVHPGAVLLVLLFLGIQIAIGQLLQKKLAHKRGEAQKHLADRLVFPIIIIFAIDGILGIITGLLTQLTPAALLQPTFVHFFPIQTPAALIENSPMPRSMGTDIQKPTPSPTSKPLTYVEMNAKFGPCIKLPTLMYHHIEDLAEAKAQGHASLAVSPTYFDSQMNYLVTHGYITPDTQKLVSFFDAGALVPAKSVLLSFDDGYDDFYTEAYPILKKYNLKSILFLPTGLVGNTGYLSWSQIEEMNNSGLVLFANHTWSHKAMSAKDADVQMEITTADNELRSHNLDNPKIFAYPYGTVGGYAQKLLLSLGYKAAFTTHSGSTLCKQQAMVLPRVRIGNASLSSYGF